MYVIVARYYAKEGKDDEIAATLREMIPIAEAEPDLIVIGVPAPVLGDIDVKRLESIAPVVAIGPSLPSACSRSGYHSPHFPALQPTGVEGRFTTCRASCAAIRRISHDSTVSGMKPPAGPASDI